MSYEGDLTPVEAWEFLKANEDAVLLDIRTDEEWNYVGMPDTNPIDRETHFVEWVTYPDHEPNPDFYPQLAAAGLEAGGHQPILIICRGGVRSVAAATAMTEAGFSPVYNVLEGLEGPIGDDGHRGHSGWRAAGLPWYQL